MARLYEPNDGKSFVVGQAPSEVAAVLKSGGAPTDHFEFSIQPLLVRSKSRVLLFDTGAGSNFGPIAGALPKSMQAAGVDPASVTDIFISHVHGDHIGGVLTPAGALAFPNAAIHISAPEWSYLSGMSADTARIVGIAQLDVLLKTIKPKVVPFKPDAELIPGLVKAVEIKGHTPGHSGYLIGSGGNTLLYFGDTLHSFVVSVRDPAVAHRVRCRPGDQRRQSRGVRRARRSERTAPVCRAFPVPRRRQDRETRRRL
jgi:glyoxylase-like metal-dependent hydrolase (beta-lactamase superfamily II)